MKPVLLLDVDGVLNVLRASSKTTIRLTVRPKGHVFRISFFPTPHTEALLRMAWKLFDVRWLTAWRDGANSIARHYKLPKAKVIPDIGGDSWKARSAEKALMDHKGPVAWIEDGIDETAQALVAVRGWTYFHCEPHIGATKEHLKALREFAERGRG